MVLPVFNRDGLPIGVFDIDSDQPAAFMPEDEAQLQSILNAVFGQLP